LPCHSCFHPLTQVPKSQLTCARSHPHLHDWFVCILICAALRPLVHTPVGLFIHSCLFAHSTGAVGIDVAQWLLRWCKLRLPAQSTMLSFECTMVILTSIVACRWNRCRMVDVDDVAAVQLRSTCHSFYGVFYGVNSKFDAVRLVSRPRFSFSLIRSYLCLVSLLLLLCCLRPFVSSLLCFPFVLYPFCPGRFLLP
jgi:hypothetical protein